ncbi:hypothetical protein M569_13481 [Genlisea aurea]|uniref:Uncharacterized protein n=1 Tax=Genlisea aurea TaxID=192259 RepID=S8DNK5_9LAMI|nr:hypothetical protein M569_13481 [Genlisea aurea]
MRCCILSKMWISSLPVILPSPLALRSLIFPFIPCSLSSMWISSLPMMILAPILLISLFILLLPVDLWVFRRIVLHHIYQFVNLLLRFCRRRRRRYPITKKPATGPEKPFGIGYEIL